MKIGDFVQVLSVFFVVFSVGVWIVAVQFFGQYRGAGVAIQIPIIPQSPPPIATFIRCNYCPPNQTLRNCSLDPYCIGIGGVCCPTGECVLSGTSCWIRACTTDQECCPGGSCVNPRDFCCTYLGQCTHDGRCIGAPCIPNVTMPRPFCGPDGECFGYNLSAPSIPGICL